MKLQTHNRKLEFEVLQALRLSKANGPFLLHVTASQNGLVYLRGAVALHADRLSIEQVISKVPGVHQVFCDFIPR